MRNRLQAVIAFAAIIATCLAGAFQWSWWAPVAGGAVLALLSITNHSLHYSLLGGGGSSTQRILMLSSGMNAVVISIAAMIIGRLIGSAFGVR